jgi:hypothetical protein
MSQGKFEFQHGKNSVDRNEYYGHPLCGISGSPFLPNQEVSSSIRIAIFLRVLAAWSRYSIHREKAI